MPAWQTLVCIWLLGCSFTPPSFAGGGEEILGALYLQEAVGCRPTAMGEAFTAVAEDANAVYYNPAGLAQTNRQELLVTHTQFIQGFRDEYFAFALPWGNQDAFGANLFFSYADLERVSPELVESGTFKTLDSYMSVAWSHAWTSQMALGLAMKGLYQAVDTWSAWSVAADLGVIWQDPWPHWTLGAVVRNLGKPIRFINQDHALPMVAEAGAAYRVGGDRLLLTGAIRKPFQQELTFHAGAEYNLEELLFLRAGYRYAQFGNDLGSWAGLSCGVGVAISDYKLDYTYSPYADLGDVHRISLTFPFGRSVKEEEKIIQRLERQIKTKQENIIRNYIREAETCTQQKNYAKALQSYSQVKLLNPDYPGLANKIQQTEINLKESNARTQLKLGKLAFDTKDYLNALIEWSKGLELSPLSPELQKAVKLANQMLSQEKVSGETTQNSKQIKEFFTKGVNFLENGRYSEAVAVWNKILEMDPKNVLVIKYLGIAKSKMQADIREQLEAAAEDWQRNATVEAVKHWRRVLGIDSRQPDALGQLKNNQAKLAQLANDINIRGMEKYVRNQLAEAIADWRIVLILEPENIKTNKHIEHAQEKMLELNKLK